MKNRLLLVSVFVLGGILCSSLAQAGTQAKVFNTKNLQAQADFFPYAENYERGVAVAIGDVTGDGQDEIVTSSGFGAKTHVRVFDKSGRPKSWSVFPFVDQYRGGGSVAVGDTDGDGQAEIIVSPAGSNSGPLVRVYQYGRNLPKHSFYVFNQGFRGGINVAAGDINKNGKAEIIAATASQRGNVAVYTATGQFTGLSFFPFGTDFREGVAVAAGDVTGNGKADIVMGSRGLTTSRVKVYKADASQRIFGDWLAYGDSFGGGVSVAVADINKDGISEILTGVGTTGKSHVRAFRSDGTPIGYFNFFPLGETDTGGLSVAANSEVVVAAPTLLKQQSDICKHKKCVALTFDDGGSQNGSFERILDTLARHDVKATFFLIGRWMDGNRGLVKRVFDEGHRLGNHTWNHSLATRIPAEQLVSELDQADSLVRLITGTPTKPHFRYPGGGHNAATNKVVRDAGYYYWQWTADPRDAMGNHDPASIRHLALTGLRPGSVILFHTGNAATAQALDGIISSIKNQGYEIVTLDQMEWRAENQW